MKLSKLWVVALAGAMVVPGTLLARDKAKQLWQVDSIWVDSNTCSSQIRNELEDRGFLVALSRKSADAAMEVDVFPERERFGDAASFTATLRGKNDRVLFSTEGDEHALDHYELCQDISDELADRLEGRIS